MITDIYVSKVCQYDPQCFLMLLPLCYHDHVNYTLVPELFYEFLLYPQIQYICLVYNHLLGNYQILSSCLVWFKKSLIVELIGYGTFITD